MNDSNYIENRVEIDGTSINYVKVGNGDHILLWFPGTMGTWDLDFKVTLETFNKKDFTHVVWEPPGLGKSRPPTPAQRVQGREQNIVDGKMANKLMKALNLLPYSVLGWSAGGRSAICAAYYDPENVKKLVFWGSQTEVSKEYMQQLQATVDIDSLGKGSLDQYIKFYGKETVQKIRKDQAVAAEKCYREHRGIDSADIVLAVKQPTLILYGDNDWLGGGLELAKKNARQMQNARLCLRMQGGHDIHIQYPEWFNSAVERFLKE